MENIFLEDSMSIGATIKQLRIARKLTQEELASHLGITSKAVSQWECDRTSPDISQIPALCNFFQISADQLLNINLQNSEEEKHDILDRYCELLRKGYLKECWQFLQEGIAKFPNDYYIMSRLSTCGKRLCQSSDISREEKDSITLQCAEYCKRILKGCTDDFTRHAAVSNLCTYYAEKGELNKAKKLVRKMPFMTMSQDFLFADIYNGSKKKDAVLRLKSNLLQFLLMRFDSNYTLDSGEQQYSSNEMDLLREKRIALLELLFDDGDFGYYSSGLSSFYEESARCYASAGNKEKVFECLEKAAYLAIDFITFMQKETFTHTSLFLKGMVEQSRNVSLNSEDNQAMVILKNMDRKEYDVVRENEMFRHLSNMLKPYIEINL